MRSRRHQALYFQRHRERLLAARKERIERQYRSALRRHEDQIAAVAADSSVPTMYRENMVAFMREFERPRKWGIPYAERRHDGLRRSDYWELRHPEYTGNQLISFLLGGGGR